MDLEQRVIALEKETAELKAQLEERPWERQIDIDELAEQLNQSLTITLDKTE
jgi:hypothetical protein